MNFIPKNLRNLLIALAAIAGLIVLAGFFYYRSLNLAEDPRIIEARKKMAEYNELMEKNETGLALLVLDRVEDIYRNTPGYEDSFELGVVLNNRGSVFLIRAATDIINDKEPNADNLAKARQYFKRTIDIYSSWLERVGALERDEVRNMILPFFPEDDPTFEGLDLNSIIEKRVDDILASKVDAARRLSVSHTNLAIVNRYEGNPEAAKAQYEKALELWPENHIAKDNLNRLLGLPPEKRNVFEQLFYKERTAYP